MKEEEARSIWNSRVLRFQSAYGCGTAVVPPQAHPSGPSQGHEKCPSMVGLEECQRPLSACHRFTLFSVNLERRNPERQSNLIYTSIYIYTRYMMIHGKLNTNLTKRWDPTLGFFISNSRSGESGRQDLCLIRSAWLTIPSSKSK